MDDENSDKISGVILSQLCKNDDDNNTTTNNNNSIDEILRDHDIFGTDEPTEDDASQIFSTSYNNSSHLFDGPHSSATSSNCKLNDDISSKLGVSERESISNPVRCETSSNFPSYSFPQLETKKSSTREELTRSSCNDCIPSHSTTSATLHHSLYTAHNIRNGAGVDHGSFSTDPTTHYPLEDCSKSPTFKCTTSVIKHGSFRGESSKRKGKRSGRLILRDGCDCPSASRINNFIPSWPLDSKGRGNDNTDITSHHVDVKEQMSSSSICQFEKRRNEVKKNITTAHNINSECEVKMKMIQIFKWTEQFVSWSSVDRNIAIDHLISVSQPSQVRHMMALIEPHFQRDFISLLPKELSLYILSFLEPRDLLAAAKTCRYWRILSEDNLLWREKCVEAGIDVGVSNLFGRRIHKRRKLTTRDIYGCEDLTKNVVDEKKEDIVALRLSCKDGVITQNFLNHTHHPPNVEAEKAETKVPVMQPQHEHVLLSSIPSHRVKDESLCSHTSLNVINESPKSILIPAQTVNHQFTHLTKPQSSLSKSTGLDELHSSSDKCKLSQCSCSCSCSSFTDSNSHYISSSHHITREYNKSSYLYSMDHNLLINPHSNTTSLPLQIPLHSHSQCNTNRNLPLNTNFKHSKYKMSYMRQHNIEMNWRVRNIRQPKVLKGHDDHVITCLQFSDSLIVSGSDDNTLKVWSSLTGECLRTLTGHTGGVWSSQMLGKIIVSGSTDRTLKVWNSESGECIHTLYGHTSTVRCMHLHNNIVVSGSRDATLRMWNVTDGHCIHVLVGHVAAVRCVQYNGGLVVSGAYDYMVKVWNAQREECIHTLTGHTNRVYSLQFDGKHVVSGSLDTSIRVWDVETGVCKHALMGHQSLTSGMELRNNILVSGNADSTVKVWDITTGQCLQTLSGPTKHQSAVTCLQFNSKFVMTSSDDGTVKLWDLTTGQFIRDLVSLESGGSGGVVWRIRASPTKLICAVGSRNGTEETKLLVLDFDSPSQFSTIATRTQCERHLMKKKTNIIIHSHSKRRRRRRKRPIITTPKIKMRREDLEVSGEMGKRRPFNLASESLTPSTQIHFSLEQGSLVSHHHCDTPQENREGRQNHSSEEEEEEESNSSTSSSSISHSSSSSLYSE